MKNRIAWIVMWLALPALTACQSTGGGGFWSSPVKVGDQIVIQKEIPIPSGQARVYLQHGRTTSYGGADQYAPFCYFVMREPLPVSQTIRTGVLQIEHVWLNETDVRLGRPVRVAGIGGVAGFGGFGGRMPIAHQFHIRLKSSEQPDVRLLVCSGAFDSPRLATPIRLPEMREALGTYAEVRVSAAEPAAQ